MSWQFRCPCGGEVASGGKAPPGGGQCLGCERVFETLGAVSAAGGSAMHLCIRGPSRPKLCQEDGCRSPHVALCDEPAGGRGTCDRRICATHRTRVGDNRDRCPKHAGGAA